MNIKDYREKELKMYIIANILMLIFLLGIFDVTEIMNSENNWLILLIKIIDSTIISSSVYVFSFLVDSLFSSELKVKLIYMFGRMPGETIFSDLRTKDDFRFSSQKVIDRYKEVYLNLPDNSKERCKYENDKWYEVYDKYRDKEMILVSNRDYLLCRDMYIITIVIAMAYILVTLFLNDFAFRWEGAIYIFVMLIITNIATRVKSNRLVRNVITYDVNKSGSTQE
ncbi:MAG: hypothetical protein ACRC3H_16130 [Lachnospiraceae bacterium]